MEVQTNLCHEIGLEYIDNPALMLKVYLVNSFLSLRNLQSIYLSLVGENQAWNEKLS